jgi:hypothetical protein
MFKTPLLAILVPLCLTTSAEAWDELGHLMVAASAYDQLTLAVQTRAREY